MNKIEVIVVENGFKILHNNKEYVESTLVKVKSLVCRLLENAANEMQIVQNREEVFSRKVKTKKEASPKEKSTIKKKSLLKK